MNERKLAMYVFMFILLFVLGFCVQVKLAYGQDCLLVFDDNDDPGTYDELSFTDDQGRDICKVRIVFHDPAEGDPNGAVFTESGEVNGYTADFNGSHVDVWRTGSPYSISHSKIWVHVVQPTSTPVPPTDIPPTDVPPTDVPPTDVPPTDVPPTDTPAVPPTDTPTLPPGETPPSPTVTPPPLPSPPATYTATPPAYPPPDKHHPPEKHSPPPELPKTGLPFGLLMGLGAFFAMLAVLAGLARRR